VTEHWPITVWVGDENLKAILSVLSAPFPEQLKERLLLSVVELDVFVREAIAPPSHGVKDAI
jgi:hypothetical protein